LAAQQSQYVFAARMQAVFIEVDRLRACLRAAGDRLNCRCAKATLPVMAAKKDRRIMRTPEDAQKLSQQVPWNKKMKGEVRSQRYRWSDTRSMVISSTRSQRFWEWITRGRTDTSNGSGKNRNAYPPPDGSDGNVAMRNKS